METSVLVVPGLRGSGPLHWQSVWLARNPAWARVVQHDWLAPRLDDWSAALDGAICGAGARVIVVAHGFGCLALLARVARQRAGVVGAMLVAPRDPAEFGLVPEPLGVPGMLVASRNDPALAYADAARLARRLGSRLIDAGEAGHLDAASGYGAWPAGERLLAALIDEVDAEQRRIEIALSISGAF